MDPVQSTGSQSPRPMHPPQMANGRAYSAQADYRAPSGRLADGAGAARRIPSPPPMPRPATPRPQGSGLSRLEPARLGSAQRASPGSLIAGMLFGEHEINSLLCGIERGVLERLADTETLGSTASAEGQFQPHEIQTMRDSWLAACRTGEVTIRCDDRHARVCAVHLQHLVEGWLAERLQGQGAFSVTAAIHTPMPATPLRQWPAAAVPDSLMAEHQRGDAGVQASISRRVGSIRDLLDTGATLYACYSQQHANENATDDEKQAYQATCRRYPSLIDAPRALSRETFIPHTGATYVFGEDPQAPTGCFAIRLPQAADASTGSVEARLIVVSSNESRFDQCIGSLALNLDLLLNAAPSPGSDLVYEYGVA